LWAICVFRLVKHQPELWGKAFDHFNRVQASIPISHEETDDTVIRDWELLQIFIKIARGKMERLVASSREEDFERNVPIHALLYRHILCNYIRTEMHVFYMPDELILRGRSLGFYFFEPRYRRLIREVMEPYPEEFRQGRIPNEENGITNPPKFIYANRSPLKRDNVACVVA
jgi:hypothetical protein